MLKPFQEEQFAFAGHLRDPEVNAAPSDVEDRRMAIYRDLFYNNIENLLSSTFPVMRELLPDDEWHALVRRYFADHRSHTPYFPQVAEDFLGYLQQEGVADSLNRPFIIELAHYEWIEMVAALAEDDIRHLPVNRGGELLQGVPVLSPTAWLLSYQYPVQKISADFQPEKPEEGGVLLVVYRNRDDDVRFMEVNPVTLRLLQLIQENGQADEPLIGKALVMQLAQEMQHQDPQALLQPATEILHGMLARDIVLGVR